MSDKIKYAVSIPFNWAGLSASNFKHCMSRPDWWEHREHLLRTYTLPSLAAQTDKDFDIWAMFMPRDAKLSQGCREAIEDFGGKCATPAPVFGGCMLDGFHEVAVKYKKADALVVVGLDSDDMYAPGAMAAVKDRPLEAGLVMLFPNGYMYDVRTGRMAKHAIDDYPEHSRMSRTLPFYAVVFTEPALRSKQQFEEYRVDWGLRRGNNTLLRADRTYLLPEDLTCYLIHEENVCGGWENRHMVSKITRHITLPKERARVIKIFGGPWK